jgi:hypothetical protein
LGCAPPLANTDVKNKFGHSVSARNIDISKLDLEDYYENNLSRSDYRIVA